MPTDSNAASNSPAPGGVTLVEKLGEGLQGTVWAARMPGVASLVAIKFYREEFAGERIEVVARLARIFSPNLLEILRYERQPDGTLMVISEYCAGGSLAALQRRGLQWRFGDLLTMMRQLAQALEALHREDIVHGDVTPANIFREKRTGAQRWILGDFGSARFASDQAAPNYRTVGFSAPELTDGRISDKSDVYSLAKVVLSTVDLGQGRSVPARFRQLIDRCLSQRSEARPTSRDLVRELIALESEHRVKRFVSDIEDQTVTDALNIPTPLSESRA